MDSEKLAEEIVNHVKVVIEKEISPSEALFMFVAGLTTHNNPVTASAKHDSAIWADLVGDFCKRFKLGEPSDNYTDKFNYCKDWRNDTISTNKE